MVILILQVRNARVAEQADAQDLKSCGLITRTGSIPVSRTKNTKALRYHCLGIFLLYLTLFKNICIIKIGNDKSTNVVLPKIFVKTYI